MSTKESLQGMSREDSFKRNVLQMRKLDVAKMGENVPMVFFPPDWPMRIPSSLSKCSVKISSWRVSARRLLSSDISSIVSRWLRMNSSWKTPPWASRETCNLTLRCKSVRQAKPEKSNCSHAMPRGSSAKSRNLAILISLRSANNAR